jgi:D-3-phosphoglycerate dehydrogenase
MALLLAIDRRIVDNADDLRAGKWAKNKYSRADGIKGKTFGVIGVGAIGSLVIARAKAFEMKVIAWSRGLTPQRAAQLGVGFCATPLDAARQADVVSLHVARAPQTQNLVNAEFLAAMKPGAILINTARGEIVDQAALVEAQDDLTGALVGYRIAELERRLEGHDEQIQVLMGAIRELMAPLSEPTRAIALEKR